MTVSELATRWWVYYGPTGALLLDEDISDAAVQESVDVDEEVIRLVLDEATFEPVMRALVETAPTAAHIPIIGTAVLEDAAFRSNATIVRNLMASSSIERSMREAIMSGFLFD